MSIKPLTERQKVLIVNNVVRACDDIEKLNKTGYNFINQASGFIAHYNLYGFRDAYSEPGSLVRNIVRNAGANMWRNFRPGDQNFDYYMSKADVYARILGKLGYNL